MLDVSPTGGATARSFPTDSVEYPLKSRAFAAGLLLFMKGILKECIQTFPGWIEGSNALLP